MRTQLQLYSRMAVLVLSVSYENDASRVNLTAELLRMVGTSPGVGSGAGGSGRLVQVAGDCGALVMPRLAGWRKDLSSDKPL